METEAHLSSGPKIPGGPHLLWIYGSLDFIFPQHTRLFLGLLQLERDGVIVNGNGRVEMNTVNASRARRAYVAWAQPSLDCARAASTRAASARAANTAASNGAGAGAQYSLA
jgi:hypothetical protein